MIKRRLVIDLVQIETKLRKSKDNFLDLVYFFR